MALFRGLHFLNDVADSGRLNYNTVLILKHFVVFQNLLKLLHKQEVLIPLLLTLVLLFCEDDNLVRR